MSKGVVILVLAILIALTAAIGVRLRSDTLAFANGTERYTHVSSIGSVVSSTNPGAWIVVDDKVYLVRADYDFNNKRWTIRQLASAQLDMQ